MAVFVQNSGTAVIIESGTYIASDEATYSFSGTVTIAAGQFSCTNGTGNDGCLAQSGGGQIVLASGSAASIYPFVNNPLATSVTVTVANYTVSFEGDAINIA